MEMTRSIVWKQFGRRFARVGLFGLLALSFGLNAYLLFLQPLGVLSLRRLILAAGIGAALSAAVGLLTRRGGTSLVEWWRTWVIEKRMWRVGLLLSAIIHLIYPAAPAQLFALPVDLEVAFYSLSVTPAEVRVVSLNNGMVDVSYKEMRLDEAAEIRPGSGVHFAVEGDTPVNFGWSGRGWRAMTLVFASDQPVEMLIRYHNLEERLRFEAPQSTERKISLPVGGWWYYGLVKMGIIALAAASLAVLTALLRISPLWEDG